METKKVNHLRDLNVPLSELYVSDDKQINIHLSDKPYTFHVVLHDRKGVPDCKISSFGANFWFRTVKGENYKAYKTIGTLERAVREAVCTKVDFIGKLSYSISDLVMHI